MDLAFTPEEEAFRDEVRGWIADSMPTHIRDKAAVSAHFSHDEVMEWHRILHTRGWAAPHWPKAAGGSELEATRRFILAEELAAAATPPLSPFGLAMVGPLIMRFGNDEQKAKHLPGIVSGETVWCQGYSEPGAGSDLASLTTRAEDKGDHFVVNGQKTWTTYAQYAHWIFCLVRTSQGERKQQGISFLLIDMNTAGVEAVPMQTIGGTPSFADTFFEDVIVPKENLLGPQDGGWTLAKALLGHERTMVGGVGMIQRGVDRLKRIAAKTQLDGKPVLEHEYWRQRVARLDMRFDAHRMANYRTLAEQAAGRNPGAESSILKIAGTNLGQAVDELTLEIMGLNGLAWFDEGGAVSPLETYVGPDYCYNRASTIYAGSNEIQKNIISKHILGLPS